MTVSSKSEISVVPIDGSFAADIVGFDFKNLPQQQLEAVREAWLKHGVLRLRGYDFTDAQHIEFSKFFGEFVPVKSMNPKHNRHSEITVISNAKVDGKSIGVLGNVDLEWHTDSWFFDRPPSGEILHALKIPRVGGDTYWANMYAIYDALPDSIRQVIEGRLIQFDVVYDGYGRLREGQQAPKTDDLRQWPSVRHPIVRTHFESGRKAVYVGYGKPERNWIVGLPLEESTAILTQIFEYVNNPKFQFRQAWQPGDLIMWDNRCTMHRRDGWAKDEIRLMHRTGTGTELPAYIC
jgi:taurine dioxygenase